MAFEDTDRRRTLVLALLTLIVLPTIYFLNRSSGNSVDDESTVGTSIVIPAESDVTPTTLGSSNRPPLEPPNDKPVFLEGPPPDPEPRVLEVAVPPRPEFEPLAMTASYRSSVSGTTTCLVAELPAGTAVTVTNVDNGRSVECVTAGPSGNQTVGVVLHRDTFALIADLTDAPVPVEVTR